MTKPRRFTIETNSGIQDEEPEAADIQNPEPVTRTQHQDVTLDEIKIVVENIVRNELKNWAPSVSSMPETSAVASETPVTESPAGDNDTTNEILRELSEIEAHIATTRAEISALKPGNGDETQFTSAKAELQEIVDATAQATNDILSESEKIVEISSILVERLPDDQIEAIGEELLSLDNASTQIMLACGFQDLTGQRITKVVNTMIFVEERISKLIELWKIEEGTGSSELVSVREDDERPDKDLLNGPQNEGEGISQNDIDAMFA